MNRLTNRSEKVAKKIVETIDKLPDAQQLRPLIIHDMLLLYERYGLAELVRCGWDWKPKPEKEKQGQDML